MINPRQDEKKKRKMKLGRDDSGSRVVIPKWQVRPAGAI